LQTSQKDFHKKLLGRLGERTAVKYLKEKGYKILEKNYKTHVGEIDIIAEKDGVVVFVEVKTRSNGSFGTPAEAVGYRKQEKYKKVAAEYLLKKKRTENECRFDVFGIENGEIEHIENAF